MSDLPTATSPQATPAPSARPSESDVRLGLALSGGGFRATLFHLGVLRRLAELDLLRHLHMISSVSGGSVLAAHYMLLLKGELERSADGCLPREMYIALVRRLQDELVATLAHAPRNLLLANPFANLRMALFGASRFRLSMAERMAGSYQRLLYRTGTERVAADDAEARANGLRLTDMAIRLPALAAMDDIQRYNALADADCVPQLVLNSATLNTAARFTFTFAEVGDEVLGYVRFDERELLLQYRRVLDEWKPSDDPERSTERAWVAAVAQGPTAARPASPRPYLAEHLAWFHAARIELAERTAAPGRTREEIARRRRDKPGGMPVFRDGPRSSAVRHLLEDWDHSLRFLEASFSVLRTAKVAAWYLLNESAWRPRGAEARAGAEGALRRGGFTRAEHRERFWTAIRDVDQVMARELHPREAAAAPPTASERDWYEFVLEMYSLRVAYNLDAEHPRDIRLPTAVQASANFPPVFGGLRLFGLFDRRRIAVLQLSDGGLNDNNGIEALLEGRCTHILASEAGPRPGIQSPVRLNRLGLLEQILVNQLPIVRRLLMRTLREQERVHTALASFSGADGPQRNEALSDLWQRYPVQAVAFFDMDSKLSDGVDDRLAPHPLAPHPLAREIALLRTDLDGFSAIEQDALLYQGYQYADRFVRRYLYPRLAPRLGLPAQPPPATPPAPLPASDAEWAHARRVLESGRSLMNRAWGIGGLERVLWLLASALGFAALLALAVLAAWGRSELLALWHSPYALANAALSVVSWIAAALLWLVPAMDVFGLWVWADGRLAARAARRR